MKLSELLGSEVVTTEGVSLGRIRDVWLRQDGPMLSSWGHALRIESLVVSRHGIGFDLGLDHGPVTGPKAVVALARRLQRHRTIPWAQVVSLGPITVVAASCVDDQAGARVGSVNRQDARRPRGPGRGRRRRRAAAR